MQSTSLPTWVEGHLIDHMRREDLPRLNRLNDDMDSGAKRIAQAGRHTYVPFHVRYKFGFARMDLDGLTIVSEAEKDLKMRIAERPLRLYWLEKCGIAAIHRPIINWNSFEIATKRLPLHRQHFLMNWISHMTIVGSIARVRKIGHQYRCPRCNDWNETYSHVVTCYHPAARRLRNSLLDGLRTWLSDNNTYPEMAEILMTTLTEWMRRPTSFRLPYIYTADNELRKTVNTQNDIGWFNMLQGMQAKGWADRQEAHYRSIQYCMKTGKSWASKLQFELWTFIWDMWQHRQLIANSQPSADDLAMQREIRVAAADELQTGMGSLPPLYRSYFAMTAATLMNKSATDIRAWLRLIRGAREADNIFANDLFSENGPHRIWLGLPRRAAPNTTPSIPLRPEHARNTDFDRNNPNGISL